MIQRPPISNLFPCTTLFLAHPFCPNRHKNRTGATLSIPAPSIGRELKRSEEHTSQYHFLRHTGFCLLLPFCSKRHKNRNGATISIPAASLGRRLKTSHQHTT